MRSQGTFEYILLLGGAIIVALIVINALVGAGNQATSQTRAATSKALNTITQEINEFNISAGYQPTGP